MIATQRLMQERQRSAASTANDWQRRAEMALRAGDEDLARAALTRRKSYQVTAHTPYPCQALCMGCGPRRAHAPQELPGDRGHPPPLPGPLHGLWRAQRSRATRATMKQGASFPCCQALHNQASGACRISNSAVTPHDIIRCFCPMSLAGLCCQEAVRPSPFCWALLEHFHAQTAADSLSKQLEQHTRASEALFGNIRALESKVTEALSKKETLKARAASAQVRS